jgi:hypothetical protein
VSKFLSKNAFLQKKLTNPKFVAVEGFCLKNTGEVELLLFFKQIKNKESKLMFFRNYG